MRRMAPVIVILAIGTFYIAMALRVAEQQISIPWMRNFGDFGPSFLHDCLAWWLGDATTLRHLM